MSPYYRMSMRLHARRPSPHLARPADRARSHRREVVTLIGGGALVVIAAYVLVIGAWVVIGT